MTERADWTAVYPGAPLILDGPTLADALGRMHRTPPALAADLSTRQIARRLSVSAGVVNRRLWRLYRDLSVHNRVGAVCAAMACGLIDPPNRKGS